MLQYKNSIEFPLVWNNKGYVDPYGKGQDEFVVRLNYEEEL